MGSVPDAPDPGLLRHKLSAAAGSNLHLPSRPVTSNSPSYFETMFSLLINC